MKYLLLAYENAGWWEALSPSQRHTFDEARRANDEALRYSGHLLSVAAVQSNCTAVTVRVQQGEMSVTDGSLIETPEHLSSLFFISARDLNEAIQVASQMPQVRGGPIEVRPINE